jgi:hypothetical protein
VSGKKTFVLRLDERTHKALEQWAADEFRSLNGQIEYLLHNALKQVKRLQREESDNEDKEKKT